MDLTAIVPNKVSTDPASYSTLLYGESKIGKTTFVNSMYGTERTLNIMTEKRFGTIENAKVQYISSWGEFKQVLTQLKRKEVQEMYDTVSIDTIENLYNFLGKYIASGYGEYVVGEGVVGYGRDYTKRKEAWFRGLKELESLPYTLVFVAHAKQVTIQVPLLDDISDETDDTSKGISGETASKISGAELVEDSDHNKMVEYQQWQPDMDAKAVSVITKLVDNILFSENNMVNGKQQRVMHLRGTLQYQAGVTFKGVKPTIPFSADAYRAEIKRALGQYDNTTDEKVLHADIHDKKFDFKKTMKRASELAVMFNDHDDMKSVTKITDRVLGKGHMVSELDDSRAEELFVVTNEMEESAKDKGYLDE